MATTHRIFKAVPFKYRPTGHPACNRLTHADRSRSGVKANCTRVARADPRRADVNLRKF